jgi:hypothetical protein
VVPDAEPAADGGGELGGPPGEEGTDALPETRAWPAAGGDGGYGLNTDSGADGAEGPPDGGIGTDADAE